jgi:hypothetical protein
MIAEVKRRRFKREAQTEDNLIKSQIADGTLVTPGSKGEMKNCLDDWNRSQRLIYINGVSLEEIYRKEGIVEVDKNGRVTTKNATEGELKGIWAKYILKNLSALNGSERVLMLQHMTNFMHQGGYLHLVQSSLLTAAIGSGFQVGTDTSVNRTKRLDISTMRDGIELTDNFEVDYFTPLDPEEESKKDYTTIYGGQLKVDDLTEKGGDVRVSRKDGRAMLSARANFVLQCLDDGAIGVKVPKFSIGSDQVFIKNNNPITEPLFGAEGEKIEKTLLQRIKERLEDIYEAFKASLHSEERPLPPADTGHPSGP